MPTYSLTSKRSKRQLGIVNDLVLRYVGVLDPRDPCHFDSCTPSLFHSPARSKFHEGHSDCEARAPEVCGSDEIDRCSNGTAHAAYDVRQPFCFPSVAETSWGKRGICRSTSCKSSSLSVLHKMIISTHDSSLGGASSSIQPSHCPWPGKTVLMLRQQLFLPLGHCRC